MDFLDIATKMMNILSPFLSSLMDVLKGTLISDKQIKSISKKIIETYFGDFYPTPPQENDIKERIGEAQSHITQAGRIISDLQYELANQSEQLNKLLVEIDEKKSIADYYANLAETSKKEFEPLKTEIESAIKRQMLAEAEKNKVVFEQALQKQLKAEAEKGKHLRRFASFIVWLVTLVLGAALGAYFIQIVGFIRAWFTS